MSAPTTAATGRGTAPGEKLSLMRRAMVRHMDQAAVVPCFYLRRTADVRGVVALRERLRAESGERPPSVNDFLVRASALALRAHPNVNASYDEGFIAQHGRVNVGVAVAVPGGLLVPAVYDADAKTPAEIGAEVRTLAGQASARKLGRDVLADATFSVSNLGMYGIEEFDAVLNPPQAAILAVGAVREQGDARLLRLTLGCDHRVLTGAEGAEFLRTLVERLEDPDALLAPGPDGAAA
jgi:pyruvate dehydrogenase E2 component (dihydrolipoamide acetyltransferase)